MSLKQWQSNGWLKKHKTNRQQILDLLEISDRDITDASTARLSADWQFGIAYNAALKLCTILLYAEGYRPERNLAHYRTLQALPLVLGKSKTGDADYLDSCRSKRNTAEYDLVGRTSRDEAKELIDFCKELREEVTGWLKEKHPDLSN